MMTSHSFLCRRRWLLLASLALPCGAHAQAPPLHSASAHQDAAVLQQLAQQFLQTQASTLPGTVTVRVDTVDPRLQLARCDAPQPYLPSGTRPLGKLMVGLRCAAPAVWHVLLPAQVSAAVSYLVSATPLTPGQALASADLLIRQGDLAALPAGVLTDPLQAQGRMLQLPVAAGLPLTRMMLKNIAVVQAGQPVRLVAHGPGFSVATEARALSSGAEGARVQTRAPNGQLISGIAQGDGSVYVSY